MARRTAVDAKNVSCFVFLLNTMDMRGTTNDSNKIEPHNSPNILLFLF